MITLLAPKKSARLTDLPRTDEETMQQLLARLAGEAGDAPQERLTPSAAKRRAKDEEEEDEKGDEDEAADDEEDVAD
ncbi:MAG TPA: hypothetical protein VLI90_01395, partial [Tepidisphaeraceae bacterium]|nr:hypothetical protein [Tepidisphaeraceae bacterium]